MRLLRITVLDLLPAHRQHFIRQFFLSLKFDFPHQLLLHLIPDLEVELPKQNKRKAVSQEVILPFFKGIIFYSVIDQMCTYYILKMKSTLKNSWKKTNHVVVSKKIFFQNFEMTFFLKSSPPPGLSTRSVIFYHMMLIIFAVHSLNLGQCLIIYFMLISHIEIFLDTLKVWSKRDFCKFAPPPMG